MEKCLDESNQYYIGTPLYDKTLANGNKWNIISDTNTKIVYGTNWNFIAKDTNIENYGKTQYNWVVNYLTGEVVQLEEDSFVNLKYGSNLATTDGLQLNVDPLNMSDNSTWGNGVTLHGVTEDDGYGWKGNEFLLDGINDYIEVYADVDAKEGITFEFYGKSYKPDLYMLGKTVIGDSNFSRRFRTMMNENEFQACFSHLDSLSNWYMNQNTKHWISKKLDHNFYNTDGYITMTADFKSNVVTIYWDGKYIDSTECSNEWLTKGGLVDNSIPFTVGLVVHGGSYEEHYSKASIYSCRLYNRVLSDDEILDNYNATTTYHNINQ